jgi:nuclear pore complex protein Nup107
MDLGITPRLRTLRDVQKVIHPLRTTADRVGKQVEQFAETLDRLANKLDTEDCRRVLPLVYEYEKIATDTVKRLKKYHEPERQERLKGSWQRKVHHNSRTPTPVGKSRGKDTQGGATTVEDLQNWEQERQTWQLLRLVLQSQYPAEDNSNSSPQNPEGKFQKPKANAPLHRYSSETDVWNAFLNHNDEVWEKHVIVEWLKSNAESTGQEIQSVIEELDAAADRGSGLLAHGWLYSKEAIKGQKRLRSWPQPLEPSSPGANTFTANTEKSKKLVTQLDPDAFSRQERSIEDEDLFFERATWLGCWEMIRRGQSWQTIRSFCKERIEGWRALAIRGDPRMPESNRKGLDALSGAQSRTLWRKMCLKAAQDGGIDDYENAVYGALSGDLASVQRVIRGWDDYLFALYNSQLLKQFDFYIQENLASRFPQTINDRSQDSFFQKVAPDDLSGNDVWQALLTNEVTKDEARSPIKMIQGSLIARSFERYIHSQGLILGRNLSNAEQKVKRLLRGTSGESGPSAPSANLSLDDYDLLRILTHVILIFLDMKAFKEASVATENIIFAYVNYLGLAGKQELLPIYASKLSEQGSIECMARQLPSITEPADQRMMMGLMKQYKLNTVQILRQQLVLLSIGASEDVEGINFPRLNILKPAKVESYDMPTIRQGFLQQEVTAEQLDLIHGVEWYLSLDGEWQETMWAGALVYKFFLREYDN